MSRRCILIGVEGNHDQAFLCKVLRELLGFSQFQGNESELEPLWRKFIPVYPPRTGRLYLRLDMPSILYTDRLSVAIYAGEGSKLIDNLNIKLADINYAEDLAAFGIIADADKSTPAQVAKTYQDGFQELFPNFPNEVSATGIVTNDSPKLGLYVLPNNADQGVLDSLLCECGEIAYPVYMERAKAYIDQFTSEEKLLKWKPFDKEKAIVATVTSVLKPGKTNTASIADNQWICSQTEQALPQLQNLTRFLKNLLEIH